MPTVEARGGGRALQNAPGQAEDRTGNRLSNNLAEHAVRPSLQDADRAEKPTQADAASTDKVEDEKAATRMAMSAAARGGEAKTAVSADGSRISRTTGGLAEKAIRPSLWDAALAGKSVPAGAEPAGKVAAAKVVTQIVMSAAADAVRGEAAVSADDSMIERQSGPG